MNKFIPGGTKHRRPDLGGRPKSDADYRTNKRPGGGKPKYEDRGARQSQVLHKATCTQCGKACEVPFRPDGSKPVLCGACFTDRNDSSFRSQSSNRSDYKPNRSYGAGNAAPRPERSNAELMQITKRLTMLEAKVSQLINMVSAMSNQAIVTPEPVLEAEEAPEAPEAAVEATEVVEKPKKPAARKKAVAKKPKK